MPNVTVLGVGGSTVTIPVNSNAAATVAQNALNLVSAAIVASQVTPLNFAGTVPPTPGKTELVFSGAAATAATIPAAGNFVSIADNQTATLNLTTASAVASTVVSGSGGLAYTQSAASVTGSLIVAGGGSNTINLAAGANTVSIDVGNGTTPGSGLVNALAGGAVVSVNGGAGNNGADLVALAGNDTAFIGGTAFVFLGDASSTVTVTDGGAAFVTGATQKISTGPGNETVAAVTGGSGPAQVETVIGASSTVAGSLNTIYVSSIPNQTIGGTAISNGSLFINPNAQNVTVFAGGGSTTLFGAGDATGVTNTGMDVVIGGIGFFHAGSAGGSLLESATSISGSGPATTLVGGGANDALYAQSANVSLRGSAGTTFMDAGGITISGGVIKLGTGALTVTATPGQVFSAAGAAGGVTINAGGSNAAIFGATSGANTIISGTGSSTVFGHSGSTSGSGNVYLDGGVGSMTIEDFNSSDTFRLTGSQTVASTVASGGGSLVTLSDGTKITLATGVVTSANVNTFFHS